MLGRAHLLPAIFIGFAVLLVAFQSGVLMQRHVFVGGTNSAANNIDATIEKEGHNWRRSKWLHFNFGIPRHAVVGSTNSGARTADVPMGEDQQAWGPLNWLHFKVILASHTSYPVPLMFGFCCFGNILLRKECGGKPYPNWLFGFPIGFICYTYAAATVSDMMFVPGALRAISDMNVFMSFTFWFVVIQRSEAVYRFLTQKHVFVFLQTWWLCDSSRASLCFLERSVSPPCPPAFSRAVWQCFIWCSARPLLQLVDKVIRGDPVPNLDVVQPNSFNFLKFPQVCMFCNMMFYMLFLTFFTDCGLFSGKEDAKSMVQCGLERPELYAACVYTPCFLHILRSYHGMYFAANKRFKPGKTLCMAGTSSNA